jgi:hypothetical protein
MAAPAVLQAAERYQLARSQALGHGSYGSVHLYTDPWDDGQQVAVKRIPLTGLLIQDRETLSILLERE